MTRTCPVQLVHEDLCVGVLNTSLVTHSILHSHSLHSLLMAVPTPLLLTQSSTHRGYDRVCVVSSRSVRSGDTGRETTSRKGRRSIYVSFTISSLTLPSGNCHKPYTTCSRCSVCVCASYRTNDCDRTDTPTTTRVSGSLPSTLPSHDHSVHNNPQHSCPDVRTPLDYDSGSVVYTPHSTPTLHRFHHLL